MELLPPLVQALVLVGLVLAMIQPRWRAFLAMALLGLAVVLLVLAAWQGGALRQLEIHHRFRSYSGQDVTSISFPVETREAPGALWLVLAAVFCLGFATWSWSRRRNGPSALFGPPLALALGGTTLALAWEKAAAPASLLLPFDLAPDRFLFPASVAAIFLLQPARRRLRQVLLYFVLFLALTRLPIAIFATWATHTGFGTHLDVHQATFIVPPGAERVGGLEVEPGSRTQLLWLVWGPHLVVYPAMYFLGLGGLAFLMAMAARQREVDRGAGRA